MKATNEQKQLLKMHEIAFKVDISFEEAKSKISKAEKRKINNQRFWSKGNDLSGSNFFSRWTEDLPRSPKKTQRK